MVITEIHRRSRLAVVRECIHVAKPTWSLTDLQLFIDEAFEGDDAHMMEVIKAHFEVITPALDL